MPALYHLLIDMLAGVILGGVGRVILRGKLHISWPSTILTATLGSAIGVGLMSVAAHYFRSGRQVVQVNEASELLGAQVVQNPLYALIAALAGTIAGLLIVNALAPNKKQTAEDILLKGETENIEFKSSARHNYHSKNKDPKIEHAVLKTIAGLGNAKGGTLLVGVDDDGNILGLEPDLQYMKSPDVDKYELWLTDLIAGSMFPGDMSEIKKTFPKIQGQTICRVDVESFKNPVYLKVNKSEEPSFYVRIGNSTRKLTVDQAVLYTKKRWSWKTWLRNI